MALPHFPVLVADFDDNSEVVDVVAPFDGAKIATISNASEHAIEKAMANAYSTFLDRKQWLPVAERIVILERVAEIMTERRDELAIEAAREGGKPLADSTVEADRAIDGIKICIEVLRTEPGKVIPMGALPSSANRIAFTQKEPIGVVVAVSAFNHPLNLIVHQVAAAVASGCPVIVKPASDTPLSCMRLVKIFHEAGLPMNWCQGFAVCCNDLATKLVVDPRVAFFSFIGSARVGWMLRSKLAPGTRAALEHGGVAPVVVAEDADLNTAIPLLTKGGFYHAGQVCVSVQRVFVHHSIAKDVANRLAEKASALTIGDPTSAETEVGPLIRHEEVDRVAEWVDEAVAAGAEVLCGGKRLSDSCYECTVLYNPPQHVKVSTGEVFGPVVCVYPCENLDEAIAQANALDVSFQAAIFTKNIDVALYGYKNLNASAVMVNDHTAFRVDGMPFAGLKSSGLSTGGIPYTMEDMQVDKMMVIKSDEI